MSNFEKGLPGRQASFVSSRQGLPGRRNEDLRSLSGSTELQAVPLVELIDAAAGINEFLLSGIVRMAFGANFYRDVLPRRKRGECFATCALRGRLKKLRMNSFFHSCHLLSLKASTLYGKISFRLFGFVMCLIPARICRADRTAD